MDRNTQSTSNWQDATVTAQKALIRLNVSAAVITGLRRQGLIDTKMRRGRGALCAKSLGLFEARYECIATIAGRLGLSLTTVYARGDFSQIQHVSVRSVANETIFVERSDMTRAELMLSELVGPVAKT